ncbi:DNA helicase RecG, partial [Microvirga sp. 3-52]|nr:DNA helicase RecG [Microvirga sp. 3-52]
MKAVFFNQHYLKDRLEPGTIVTVTGKWDRGRQSINVSNFTSGPKSEQANFEPVYSLKGVMHQKTFRRFMRSALDSVAGLHKDPLPADILEAYKLPTLEQALEMIHFPKSPAHMKHARRRFVYEELLLF